MAYIPIEDIIDDDQSSLPIHDYGNDKYRFSIDIFPTELVFPDQNEPTESSSIAVLIRNNGFEPIDNLGLVVIGPFEITNTPDTALEVGDTISVEVSFTPTSVEDFTGGLYITNPEINGTRFIKFTGSGI